MKPWNRSVRFGRPIRFLILLVMVLTIQSCAQTRRTESGPFFLQDINILRDSNGRIVSSERYPVEGERNGVEGFRISYLSDGLRITGYLFKPREATHKLPVLIYCRGGGPIWGRVDKKITDYLAFLASNKYLVLASMYRGSCSSEGDDQFGGEDVHDVLNLLPLAASIPFADSNRIGMLGYSRGGMMTLLSIKDGADIKAAALVGAITDLEITYREQASWFRRLGLSFLVGRPDDEPEAYRQRSAVNWAEAVNVPLLILHGTSDSKINVSQAQRLADRLRQTGATYELVLYSGGNHELDNYAPDRDRRILDWFDTYLKLPSG